MLKKTDAQQPRLPSDADMRRAINKGDIKAVRRILASGYAIDQEFVIDTSFDRIAVGQNALRLATYHGHIKIVQLLIEHGANLDARDRVGQTALHHAVFKGTWAMCQFLLGAGAQINASHIGGDTPLQLAVDEDDEAMCAMLIAAGASSSFVPEDTIKRKNHIFLTPFQRAVEGGESTMVSFLFEQEKVDMDQKTVNGRTLDDLAQQNPEMRALLYSLRTEAAIAAAMPGDGAAAPARKADMGML